MMQRLFSRAAVRSIAKFRRFQLGLETLDRREVFSASPYLVPTAAGVEFTPILTTPDATKGQTDNSGFKMAGTPDGLGAFDNGIRPFSIVPWKAHVAVRSFILAAVSQPRAQRGLGERTLEATGAGSARLTGDIIGKGSGDSRLGLG